MASRDTSIGAGGGSSWGSLADSLPLVGSGRMADAVSAAAGGGKAELMPDPAAAAVAGPTTLTMTGPLAGASNSGQAQRPAAGHEGETGQPGGQAS